MQSRKTHTSSKLACHRVMSWEEDRRGNSLSGPTPKFWGVAADGQGLALSIGKNIAYFASFGVLRVMQGLVHWG